MLRRLNPNEGFVVQLAVVGYFLVSVHEINVAYNPEESRTFVWDMGRDWEQTAVVMAKTTGSIISVVPFSPNIVLFSALGGAEFWKTTNWEYESKNIYTKGSCTICEGTYVFG